MPRQVIILRHGEKLTDYALCDVGQQRSLALARNYLGKGAANSLFPDGTGPDGFMSITLHSLELISPAAQSWNMPVDTFSVFRSTSPSRRQLWNSTDAPKRLHVTC